MDYSDPGASYYEERHRQRVVQNLERRAKQLGFTLEPAPAAGVSWEALEPQRTQRTQRRSMPCFNEDIHPGVTVVRIAVSCFPLCPLRLCGSPGIQGKC
jgi:hypothetical protein